ncbi:MAG TPA: hypothetical protein VL523_10205 [Terriglobia bacterium]|nr:hypothetical protein [Terriglobia bacterium]
MGPWHCFLLVVSFGAIGGAVNALISDNGFVAPSYLHGVLCPGFITNVLIGAFSAFASWSFYGSGVAVDLAKMGASAPQQLSLTFSALAGAFLVGVAGAKWLTNEVDKKLWKQGVKEAVRKKISVEECDANIQGSARQFLQAVKDS